MTDAYLPPAGPTRTHIRSMRYVSTERVLQLSIIHWQLIRDNTPDTYAAFLSTSVDSQKKLAIEEMRRRGLFTPEEYPSRSLCFACTHDNNVTSTTACSRCVVWPQPEDSHSRYSCEREGSPYEAWRMSCVRVLELGRSTPPGNWRAMRDLMRKHAQEMVTLLEERLHEEMGTQVQVPHHPV